MTNPPGNEGAPPVAPGDAQENNIEAGRHDNADVTTKVTAEQLADLKRELRPILEERGSPFLDLLLGVYGARIPRDVPAALAPALLRDAQLLRDEPVSDELQAAARKVLQVATAASIDCARSNLSGDLRELRAWVACDRTVKRNKAGESKSSKVPLDPATGRKARSNDASTWGTFDEAAAFALRDPRAACLGVNLLGSPFMGFDLDNVIDDSGALLPAAAEMLRKLPPTYWERSPSGRGLRGFYRGTKPSWLRGCFAKNAFGEGTALEVYDGSGGSRYLTTTGNVFGKPAPIRELVDGDLDALRPLFEHAPPERDASGDEARDADYDLARAKFLVAEGAVDPDEEHPVWLRHVMALASLGSEGEELARQHSERGTKYDASKDCSPQQFEGFRGDVTIGTFFEAADEADPTWRSRFDEAHPTWRRERIARDFAKQVPDAPSELRPIIIVDAGESPRMAAEAERALLKSPAGAQVFQRSGQAVRVEHRPDPVERTGCKLPAGAPTITGISSPWLEKALEASARFVKVGEKGQTRRVHCPVKLAEKYLADAGAWRLPPLAGIVAAPTLRVDGSLLEQPGYDAATGLLFDPLGCSFPQVPAAPTRDDALRALDALLEPISEFPFVAPHDRSTWLAALLTALVRHTLPAAPLTLFDAHVAGSGKSTLVEMLALLVTGRPAPCMTQGAGEEETSKAMLAMLAAGVALIVIDNIEEPLAGATLASVLTQQVFRGRVLGVTRILDVPTSATFLATGNNVVVQGDLTRRVVTCRLDPGVERPDGRRFPFDPREVVTARRGELVVAALTILWAFEVAGRPGVTELEPFGSFEAWSASVRGPLVWLGLPDPLLGRQQLADADPVLSMLRRLLQAWQVVFGSREVTAREVLDAAIAGEPFASGGDVAPPARLLGDALRELLGVDRLGNDGVRLGQALARHRGRIVSGLRLIDRLGKGGINKWAIARPHGGGVEGLGGVPDRRGRNSGPSVLGTQQPPAGEKHGDGAPTPHPTPQPHSRAAGVDWE